MIGGGVLIAVERLPQRPATVRTITGISLRQVIAVGLGQVCAIVPGVSRFGAAIVGGLLAGLDRETATRFAFNLVTGWSPSGLPGIAYGWQCAEAAACSGYVAGLGPRSDRVPLPSDQPATSHPDARRRQPVQPSREPRPTHARRPERAAARPCSGLGRGAGQHWLAAALRRPQHLRRLRVYRIIPG